MNFFNRIKLKKLIEQGLIVGQNFKIEKGCMIDASFPWLIEIGDNVTMAPYSYILSHDGSSKSFIGYSKIGKVKIGDNVFIGAKSIILPNVRVGDNVVIAAGSIITKDIPNNCVVAGNPAKVISTIESFIDKNREAMNRSEKYDISYTKRGNVTKEKKAEMNSKLKNIIGYID